jgi:putative peptidoglycan lipid II flippase
VGFVAEAALAWRFGVSGTVDAFRIGMLTLLVAQQLLLAQVVPSVIVLLFAKYKDEDPWRACLSFGAVASLAAAVAAAAVVAAPGPVLHVLGPGLQGAAQAEAATFIRCFSLTWVPLCIVGILMGIFQAHGVFWLSPACALGGNVVLASSILGLGRALGTASLLVGVVGSAILHLVAHASYLGAMLRRREIASSLPLSLRHPGIRVGVRLAAPLMLGVVFAQCGAVALNRALSTLPPGSLAVFGYAWKLGSIMTFLPMSLAIVLFPQLARDWVRGPDAYRNACRDALRAALFFGLPAGALFFTLREPLVRLVLQRGAFSGQATAAAIELFGLMVLAAPAAIVSGYLTKMLHAAWNTRAPAWVQAIGATMLMITTPSVATHWGLFGVAVLTVGVTWCNALLLLGVMQRRHGNVGIRDLGLFCLRVGTAALASAWVASAAMRSSPWPSGVGMAAQPAVALLLGGGTFLIACAATGIPEARRCLDYVQWQGRWFRDAIRGVVGG